MMRETELSVCMDWPSKDGRVATVTKLMAKNRNMWYARRKGSDSY